MSTNERALDPAPPKKPEEIAEGPSGLIGPKLLGIRSKYHINDPEFLMGPWQGAKKVDFAGMTETPSDPDHDFMMGL